MPVVLYIVGCLSVVIGILGIFALAEDKTSADAIIAFLGIAGGSLLSGFAYGLQKLSQIEEHLRRTTSSPPQS